MKKRSRELKIEQSDRAFLPIPNSDRASFSSQSRSSFLLIPTPDRAFPHPNTRSRFLLILNPIAPSLSSQNPIEPSLSSQTPIAPFLIPKPDRAFLLILIILNNDRAFPIHKPDAYGSVSDLRAFLLIPKQRCGKATALRASRLLSLSSTNHKLK